MGTIRINKNGHAEGDGSVAAHNALHGTNHGFRPEHGEKALDGIVKHFGNSSYISAHHCQKRGCG